MLSATLFESKQKLSFSREGRVRGGISPRIQTSTSKFLLPQPSAADAATDNRIYQFINSKNVFPLKYFVLPYFERKAFIVFFVNWRIRLLQTPPLGKGPSSFNTYPSDIGQSSSSSCPFFLSIHTHSHRLPVYLSISHPSLDGRGIAQYSRYGRLEN